VQSAVIVDFDYMRFAAKCTLQNLQPKKERAVVRWEWWRKLIFYYFSAL